MKKLLIILMVVAMASFLFVGCLGGGVTPPVDGDEDEDEDEVLASATPVLTDVQESDGTSIFDVTSTATLYMNDDELGDSILVTGTAPSESLVRIYLDDVAIAPAVAEAATSGLWEIAIAASSLGDDGEKVMTAKVTEVGLAESAKSNEVKFTLDTVSPGIDAIAATAEKAKAVVSKVVSGDNPLAALGFNGGTLTAGTWTIYCLTDSADSTANVQITPPTDTATIYDVNINDKVYVIPGVIMTFGSDWSTGFSVTVTTTKKIKSRAKIVFDEDVNYAGMEAGTYAGTIAIGDPGVYKETINTGYWVDKVVGAAGVTFTITVYDVEDLAENVGGTSAVPLTASCTVGAASATLLEP